MRPILLALALASAVLAPSALPAQPAIPSYIADAVANPARPQAQRDVDELRKPAETIAFVGLKPGDRVVELLPGGGYFTRIFSRIVGPSGQVFVVVGEETTRKSTKGVDTMTQIANDPAFGRLTVLVQPIAAFRAPAPADVVWTSLNYHDLHTQGFGPADIAAFNKSAFAALKPGGVFLVLDHAARPGSGLGDTETLHRIDPAAVRAEVEAAGFVLEATSDILAEPGDTHTLRVFDSDVRGKTDKFIFKFRKPRS